MRNFEKDWEKALEYNKQFYNIEIKTELVDMTLKRHWQVQLDVNALNKLYEINIDIPIEGKNEDFPLTLPKLYISEKDRSLIKGLPNIESNGFVCTFDPATTRTSVNNPEEIIRECLERTREILTEGLEGKNKDNYTEEFTAYWNSGYIESKKIINCISTINESTAEPTNIKAFHINPPQQGFYSLMLSSDENNINTFLDFIRIKSGFSEIELLYVGELTFSEPPFVLTNRQSLDKIIATKPEIKNELIRYINKSSFPLIIFKKTINGKSLYFGWHYKYAKKHNGFRKERLTPYNILYNLEGGKTVFGILPNLFTNERLELRSLELPEEKTKELKIAIVGLGSLGSNLIPFLKSTRINEFRLIDSDDLRIENLGRHFLGFEYLERNKALAMKDYLQGTNPYYKVLTREKSIVKIINDEPDVINECDYIFVCIGNSNVEEWIDIQMKKGLVNKPIFYLWVEPYLAGGHCIFVPSNSKVGFSEMFTDNYYVKNIIDKSEYDKNDLHLREAGCQTTFVQYSYSNVVLFLSSLYPKILDIISTDVKTAEYFTWIGDVSFLKSLNLKLTGNYNSGTIMRGLLA